MKCKQCDGLGILPTGGDQYSTRWECENCEGTGKKAAGRLLDGVEHNAFPEVAR